MTSQFDNFLLSSKINEQIFGQKKEHMIVKVNILYHAPNFVIVMPFSTQFLKKYIIKQNFRIFSLLW